MGYGDNVLQRLFLSQLVFEFVLQKTISAIFFLKNSGKF